METLYAVLMGIDVLLAIAMIALILVQHGKGADAGAAFGSGASATVFGARGSGSFLTRTTALMAAAFFVNSLVLAHLAVNKPDVESVLGETVPVQTDQEAPAQEAVLPESDVPADSGVGGQAGADRPGPVDADLPVQDLPVQDRSETGRAPVQDVPE